MVDHDKVFNEFTAEVRIQAGSALRTLLVYGSSLGEHFRAGVSDYNFLLICEPVDLDLLDRLAAKTGKWRRRRIAAPLVMRPEFVRTALDSYPLEFLSIASRYRVLHGDDPLRDLEFHREHVRLQCEREIRSKLLLFRRAYLESEGAPKRLKLILDRGLPSVVAILRGLLWLKGGPWKAEGSEFWEAARSQLELPMGMLPSMQETRGTRRVPARAVVRQQFGEVVDGLARLMSEVDRW